MYIIAGLGNPGKEYENTRHNIGFDVIDRLAEEENIAVMESKHKALIGKGYVAGTEGDPGEAPDLHEPKRREHPGDRGLLQGG